MADNVHTHESGAITAMHPPQEPARTEENGVDIEGSSDTVFNGHLEKQGTPNQTDEFVPNYLKGWRLHSISASLCLCLFLVNIEIPIVSTSLVGITNSLQGFDQSSWIVSAYLLTYIGFLIIWAKLSDIFGRKKSISIAIVIFIVFSGVCGASQNIIELIVFRAFQGIGGAGIYAISFAIFFELVPQEKFAAYTGFVSIAFSLSLLVGPILGGAINNSSTWKWAFIFNAPVAAVALCVLLVNIPRDFPYHGQPTHKRNKRRTYRESLERVDFLGFIFLLAATILLVAPLEEAGIRYAWNTPFIIALLVLSGLFWIAFVIWSWKITETAGNCEPVFPWRFLQSRIWIGMIINAFFLGAPFTVAVFSIPQRFAVVNGLSPLQAGIRLIPFSFASPVGSILASIIAGKAKLPPIYIVITASAMQVIGFSLLATISTTSNVIRAQYGYQVIAGLGVGANISTLILLTPFSVEKRDQAVAVGCINQFRLMGGAIGLAIVTSVLNSHVQSILPGFLSQSQIDMLLQRSGTITQFPPHVQEMVKLVFAQGYNNQMKVLIGFAAAQIPGSLIMWQKKQIIV